MTFTEATTVERMVLDTFTRSRKLPWPAPVGERPLGWAGSLGRDLRPARWEYVPACDVPSRLGDVPVEAWLREVSLVEHGPPRGAGAG